MRITPCLVVVAIATGCNGGTPGTAAVAEPAETTTSGALTVDWTIRGTTDPGQCAASAAAVIEVTVLNRDNANVGSFQQSCSTFATSISLDAGLYTASARLLDASGAARTRPVSIESLTINVSSELTQPIDFPAASFF